MTFPPVNRRDEYDIALVALNRLKIPDDERIERIPPASAVTRYLRIFRRLTIQHFIHMIALRLVHRYNRQAEIAILGIFHELVRRLHDMLGFGRISAVLVESILDVMIANTASVLVFVRPRKDDQFVVVEMFVRKLDQTTVARAIMPSEKS